VTCVGWKGWWSAPGAARKFYRRAVWIQENDLQFWVDLIQGIKLASTSTSAVIESLISDLAGRMNVDCFVTRVVSRSPPCWAAHNRWWQSIPGCSAQPGCPEPELNCLSPGRCIFIERDVFQALR
jgi:hypothetical protein